MNQKKEWVEAEWFDEAAQKFKSCKFVSKVKAEKWLTQKGIRKYTLTPCNTSLL